MRNEMIDEEQRIAQERDAVETRLAAVGLDRTIGELLNLQPVLTCEPSTAVRQAIEIMQSERRGCLLVVNQGRLVGVFTERDVLLKVAARQIDIDQMQVGQLMTPDPECLGMDNELVYALNQMSVGGYRHVPLVDDQGRPVGIVSMRDIVDDLASMFPDAVLNLPPSPAHGIPRTPEGA